MFRNQVLETVMEEEVRTVGRSYGLDLATVVKHCLVAKRREGIRDILIFLTLALTSILYVYYMSHVVTTGALPTSNAIFEIPLAFIGLWSIFFVDMLICHYGIVGKYLLKGQYSPDAIGWKPNQREEKRLTQITAEQQSHVIAYSGFSPFVGSGFSVQEWSFALNCNTGKEALGSSCKPIPFTINDLYESLENSIKVLNIGSIVMEDQLYVHGQDVISRDNFLGGVLSRNLVADEPFLIQSYINNPTSAIRHYKCFRIVDWEGELIVSVFVRFAKINHHLFVETNYYTLCPLRDSFHKVDAMQPEPTFRHVCQLIARSTLLALVTINLCLPIMFFRGMKYINKTFKRRSIRQMVKSSPHFDYGAEISLRQIASSPEYRHYFQKLDRLMYHKIIEREVLETLTNFLDDHNIDTSELKERQTAILNNGIIVSSGDVKAESIAVGEGATSKVAQFANKFRYASGNAAPPAATTTK